MRKVKIDKLELYELKQKADISYEIKQLEILLKMYKEYEIDDYKLGLINGLENALSIIKGTRLKDGFTGHTKKVLNNSEDILKTKLIEKIIKAVDENIKIDFYKGSEIVEKYGKIIEVDFILGEEE